MEYRIIVEDSKIKPEIKIKKELNQLGAQKIPFLFVIDFTINDFYLAPLAQLEPQIFFVIDDKSNLTDFYNFYYHVHFFPNPFPLSSPSFTLKKNRSV